MRIYLPTDEPETWEFRSGTQVHVISTPDGWADLPLDCHGYFEIVRKSKIIALTRILDLDTMEKTVSIQSIETGLQHINFQVVNKTRIFYANDTHIITLCRVSGLEVATPITISWYVDDTLTFGVIAIIPACSSPGRAVTYLHGLTLTPETPKGSWIGILRLLTGKELGRVEMALLPRNRGHYVCGAVPTQGP